MEMCAFRESDLMNNDMLRRDFLKTAPAAAGMVAGVTRGARAQSAGSSSRLRLETFNYQGVKLRESRWQQQYQAARDYYFAVSDDDILQGFRSAAGLPAPGKPLGGWCARDSSTVFGQWLSGMSRVYRATGDTAMRDKAVYLMTEWAKTVGPDGNCRMRHYTYEKLVCGLVDMQEYAGQQDAIGLLERVTDWASKTFDRERAPAAPRPWELHSGRPGEWYTLPENLYRAYQLTGNPKFKDFAEVWLYHPYWNKFTDTPAPPDAWGVHAYSHVNTFSSAATAYAVSGDAKYLQVIKNAYDYLQNTQCYATGGYGPAERIMPANGNLGKSLEIRADSFETPCGSWAGFKLARYLMQFTGEARYGDWAERLFYNGIGATLPITGRGRHFYYADYRVSGALKAYDNGAYTCCTGTYLQDVVDYHNLIYYKDASGLYINLYVPSEVTWNRPDGEVKLVQDTRYPEEETTTLVLEMKQSMSFPLKFRVPGWAHNVSVKLNGAAASVVCTPGTWATIARTWNPGDRVEIRIPLSLRLQPIDRQHPKRVAVVRGPAVLVQAANAHEPVFQLPETDEELNKWLVPDRAPSVFRLVPPDGSTVQARFRPFYAAGESALYRMYFDLDRLPIILW